MKMEAIRFVKEKAQRIALPLFSIGTALSLLNPAAHVSFAQNLRSKITLVTDCYANDGQIIFPREGQLHAKTTDLNGSGFTAEALADTSDNPLVKRYLNVRAKGGVSSRFLVSASLYEVVASSAEERAGFSDSEFPLGKASVLVDRIQEEAYCE